VKATTSYNDTKHYAEHTLQATQQILSTRISRFFQTQLSSTYTPTQFLKSLL